MTLAEHQARLAEIQTAISRALQGQTITFEGRSWTSQDLETLRAMEAAELAAIANLQGRSRSRVGVMDRGFGP